MRDDACFGVVAVQEESSRGGDHIFGVGTAARIVDWDKTQEGLLAIVTRGEQRFRIDSVGKKTGGLDVARVAWLQPEPSIEVPESLKYLATVVLGLLEEFTPIYGEVPRNPDDASWLGYRLAELLPLPIAQKQMYLEMEDPIGRLQQLARDVSHLRSDA